MRRRRGRWRRVIGALVVVLLGLVVAAYWYERPLLLTATGYAAHNACAVTHLAGRADPAADLPPNPLVPYLRTSDTDGGSATQAGIFGLLARQKAWYVEGYGCILAATRPDLPTPTKVATPNALTTATAPAPDAAVTQALAKAFGDDLPADRKASLGTRAIVVLRGGKLVAERYADGFDATTRQLGWSMSKSVTDLLAGRLVQSGTVALGDARLRPEWSDDRSRITLDQLLRMTSGLRWDETYALGTPVTQMLYREADMGAYAASLPLDHPPGTYQEYSSGSTDIVCSVLAARTGDGADLPRQTLFDQLGLSSAVWEPDAAGTPVCSSYLWATPRDWAAIGQFALQQGEWNGRRWLPDGWMSAATRHVAVPGEETGYAQGWWVNQLADGSLVEKDLPADAYWAQGHDGQRLYVVPSADLVVVRLGFSPSIDSADLRTVALVHDLIAAP